MAVDFYLKLDSINGESVAQGHTKEIQILSFSWGASQTSSVAGTGGSGAGKAHLADLSIMKTVDSASVPLFKALTLGTHIVSGTLTAVKASGATSSQPFLKVTLGELFVTSIQTSGSSEIPMESVSFSYNTINIQYSTQDDKGTMTVAGAAGWNVKTNTAS
jgi:type VI secretion system secreted protein Hcp